MGQMIKSLLYFLWAGLFEIGGGYLIWLWLREGKPFWWYSGGNFNGHFCHDSSQRRR
ncbi:hypothetical protein F8S20_24745 [Nostoc sp. BAE]|nr:hypothetical protein [Nostoc commune BAE]